MEIIKSMYLENVKNHYYNESMMNKSTMIYNEKLPNHLATRSPQSQVYTLYIITIEKIR